MNESVARAELSPAGITARAVPRIVMAAFSVWLAVAILLGASGALVGVPGRPPLLVFAAAVIPLIMFVVATRVSAAFRDFVASCDMRLIVAMQAWRYAGFGFIALYANHLLPGLFAWPAGLGDMAIAIVAPWWVVAMSRNPHAAASRKFKLWNALGILDLVVAFAMATVCVMTNSSDVPPTMAPMAQLPLVLIPVFMVPAFVMLHIISLMQSKRAKT